MVSDMEVYSLGDTKATTASMDKTPDVHARLREKAAALGADAVIVKDQGIIPPLDTSSSSARAYAKGVAIHFTDAGQNGPVTSSAPTGP